MTKKKQELNSYFYNLETKVSYSFNKESESKAMPSFSKLHLPLFFIKKSIISSVVFNTSITSLREFSTVLSFFSFSISPTISFLYKSM